MRRPRLTLERTKCCHAQRMAVLPRRVSLVSLRASAVSERRARHALKDVATEFERRRELCRRGCCAAAVLAFAAAQRHHELHAVRSADFWPQRVKLASARGLSGLFGLRLDGILNLETVVVDWQSAVRARVHLAPRR